MPGPLWNTPRFFFITGISFPMCRWPMLSTSTDPQVPWPRYYSDRLPVSELQMCGSICNRDVCLIFAESWERRGEGSASTRESRSLNLKSLTGFPRSGPPRSSMPFWRRCVAERRSEESSHPPGTGATSARSPPIWRLTDGSSSLNHEPPTRCLPPFTPRPILSPGSPLKGLLLSDPVPLSVHALISRRRLFGPVR